MPLKSCFHACGKSARLAFGLPFALVLVTYPACPAFAQPGDDAARQYQQDQKHLVQDIRAISESLLTEELKGREADEETGEIGAPGAFAKVERDYRNIIKRGIQGGGQQALDTLKTGLKYRIYRLSDPGVQADYQDLDAAAGNLIRDLEAAKSITNPEDQKRFRLQVAQEALPLLEEVINKGNLTARSVAIRALPALEVLTPSALQRRLEMYDQVDDALIRILQDKDQPDVIKLRAAAATKQYLEKADAVPQVELALANALATELRNPLSQWEYQYFLIEVLSRVRPPREVVGVKKPTVIEVLVDVLEDSQRDILVRCFAAAALGRVNHDANINFEPLAWKTAQLAVEAALTIGRKTPPAQQQRRELCGWYLFTAFHHGDDKAKEGRNPQGFLNRAPTSELVRQAYENVLPIVRSLMTPRRDVPNDEILKASDWVKNNRPDNMKFDATSDPVE